MAGSQWTTGVTRQGQNCEIRFNAADGTGHTFLLPQNEAVRMSGLIDGIYGVGATSASVTAAASPSGGRKPGKAARRTSTARR